MEQAPERDRPTARDRVLDQDPHAVSLDSDGRLERTIGQQVKKYRQEMALTNSELARNAGISQGMLSKIENGQISPSLATLRVLAAALNVPLTALFRGYEKEGEATFVKAGQGLNIERRGTRSGHQYQLLGHSPKGPVTVEPYLITLTSESDVFPLFQHDGLELVYLLSGEVGYRHGPNVYHMQPGDSLFFDATVSHGPELLTTLPIRLLSVISYVRG
ncbi:MAG TPA: XRE family transcriptional regulator [Thermohalobaculum sp.]|nr:XRE family transcriptional regulator [Thermohalobaculum sp.]